MAFLHFSWFNLYGHKMVLFIHKQEEKGWVLILFFVVIVVREENFDQALLASLIRIGSRDCDLAAEETGKVGSLIFSTFTVGGELCL